METILVIDDDPGFRKLLEAILIGESYSVDSAGSVTEAKRCGERRQYHLVLTDLRLPDGDGTEILRWFKEQSAGTPVIMITAFGTVSSAVEAMKLGAADYLGKPLSSPDELRVLVRRTLDAQQIEQERDVLREENRIRFACDNLLAEDPKMIATLELARKVAPTNATVLLMGQSGAGKEVLARCIHMNSPRAKRVFVAVNCAALSPALIESELFGHEKGAFTGAVVQHVGRFERAHGGTLFLDEIAELDGSLQSKLLRVIQERTFERVGGTRQITVDVRLIAATNRNLKQAVTDGKFREDLYYRLNTFPLEIPPLKERPADVPALARFFLARAAKNLGKPSLELDKDAIDALLAYPWPGNVRELENMMERVAILCDRRVEARDLPISQTESPRPVRWRDIERQSIEDALSAHRGNRTQAARQLGISLRKLQYRLKEYGIAATE